MQPRHETRRSLFRSVTGATIVGIAFFAAVPGCGDDLTALLNPAFVNTLSGTNFPLAPRPENEFVLVRVVNTTSDPISVLVTAERATVVGEGDELPCRLSLRIASVAQFQSFKNWALFPDIESS